MKSKTQILFGFFWICCVAHADLSAQTVVAQSQYRFQHFNVNDGIPSDFVTSIAEDSLGFIWFSNYGGLSRFDGYNFKIYKHDPTNIKTSLPRGEIGYLKSDSKGNIWISTRAQPNEITLSRHNRRSDDFTTFRIAQEAEVSQFYFDKHSPTIWFCTFDKGLFSFNTDTGETRNYPNNHPNSLIRGPRNVMHNIINQDSCFLIASQAGLWKFNKKTKSFSRPQCNPGDSSLLYQSWAMFLDSGTNNTIWLLLSGKLVMVNQGLSIVHRFQLPVGFFFHNLVVDKEGTLWLASFTQGLYRYNPLDSSFLNIRNVPGDPYSLKTNQLHCVIVDKYQNLWIGSALGISKLPKKMLNVYNFKFPRRIDESMVYLGDKRDFLILSQHKKNSLEISIAPLISDQFDSLQFNTLKEFKSEYADLLRVLGLWKGKRNFWMSISNMGVINLPINDRGLPDPTRSRRLSNDQENPNTISSDRASFVWEDPGENLWLGNQLGLTKVNPNIPYGSNGSVVHYKHSKQNPNTLDNDIVWNVCPENDSSFWIITDTGVGIFHKEKVHRAFTELSNPTYVHKAVDGNIFIGAADGIHEATKQNGQYALVKNPSLTIEYVVRIHEDKLERLWITSHNGLYCYDRKKNVLIKFNEKDGFDHMRAIHSSYREYKTSDGFIVISDPQGISIFDPLSLNITEEKTFPILTSLEINNKQPKVEGIGNNSDEFAIKRNITILDELTLDYQRNNFTIEFSSMEMTHPERNLFRHKLEGFDEDWIETDSKSRTATYTNLDPGKYIFKVKASNYHGIWSDQETTLNVHILPPPWKTWWAYALYSLAIVGIFLYWRRYEIRRLKLKHRAEHLIELDHLKTRFFANISHEFRTPISLILGPLKEMYNKANDDQSRSGIAIMLRNAKRLLRLINQLLDLSKLEAGKMKLSASPVELVEFLRDIASSYESLATTKKIKYFFYAEVAQLTVYIDSEKVEKIVHNLLSNAFKFTKEGGQVILNLKADEKHCSIIVKDTGIGIPGDQLNKVFDRFYQVDSSQTRGYEGSGLGLALAKDLVELHRGKISVHSKEGKGTTLTVTLPLGKEHLRKDQIADRRETIKAGLIEEDLVPSNFREAVMENEKVMESETASESPVLLIVEDNIDMRQYIRKTLSAHYQIIEAENGKDGVNKAEENMPDLVISDIMMPEMDGITMTDRLKKDIRTSHVPIILLTAKATDEAKITGLNTGADDYLVKPFNNDELILKVRNMIESRIRVREKARLEFMSGAPTIAAISADGKLLQKVKEAILNRLSDEQLSVDSLAEEIGLSRAHFYRKITALTGLPVNELIQSFRLERAGQLLAQHWGSVSQVAYEVGFSNPSYFSKRFKDKFGVSPSEYSVKNRERA